MDDNSKKPPSQGAAFCFYGPVGSQRQLVRGVKVGSVVNGRLANRPTGGRLICVIHINPLLSWRSRGGRPGKGRFVQQRLLGLI
jgi:hypothetical protein